MPEKDRPKDMDTKTRRDMTRKRKQRHVIREVRGQERKVVVVKVNLRHKKPQRHIGGERQTRREMERQVEKVRQTGKRDIRRYLPDACPEGT